MVKYIVKRVLMIIPTMLIVSLIVFLLCNITPSDPGRIKLGADAPQEAVDEINHELGYDRPLLVRYGMWVWDALHGDFGTSYYTNRPVFEEVMARLPYTLKLAVLGIISSMLVGIPLGVLCAVRQYSVADYTLSSLAMFLAAMPVFWLSLILLLNFSMRLGWFPSNGVTAGWRSWVLPTIPLTLGYGAGYIRYARTAMLDNIRQDYVRTARAKGCSERAVVWKHAFRNSMMTIVTITGMSFAGLMGGAFVIESVFSIPGLGLMGVTAINRKDMPQILASLMAIGTLFMVIMVIIDVVYALLNPRIRSSMMSGGKKKKQRAESEQEALSSEEIDQLQNPKMPEWSMQMIREKGGKCGGSA